jgi:hypothetical protein
MAQAELNDLVTRFGPSQDITKMEKRYSGKQSANKLADYILTVIIREIPIGEFHFI